MNAFLERWWLWIACAALVLGFSINEARAAVVMVDPVTVPNVGDRATVSWTADGVGCTMEYATAEGATGSWGTVSGSGSEPAFMQSSTRFSLKCDGEVVASAAVVVAGVPAPAAPALPQPEAPDIEDADDLEDEPQVMVDLCPLGSEIRTLFRKMPVKPNRLYWGCRNPESQMTYTWFSDLTAAQEAAIRSWGSYALRSTTWPYPKGLALEEAWEAVTLCDRWYLWADNDAAAPKMTRAAKLKQAGC